MTTWGKMSTSLNSLTRNLRPSVLFLGSVLNGRGKLSKDEGKDGILTCTLLKTGLTSHLKWELHATLLLVCAVQCRALE